MEIIINGKKEETEARTINDIVEKRKLDKSGLVIEHNGKILQQDNWPERKIQNGDKLELLSFVGGG
ncbi:MAG: sulfur carrier protein ThiS [Bacillota bacterium]